MFKEVLFVLGISLVTIESFMTSCTLDSDCGNVGCCIRREQPMIMSRKRLSQISGDPSSISIMLQGGYCQDYKKEHQSCSVFGQVNGHCQCGPGLTCKFVEFPTLGSGIHYMHSRSMVFLGNGTYKCVRS